MGKPTNFGSKSNIVRFKLKKADTAQGITGIVFNSAGLIISTITDKEAAVTVYTTTGSTIEDITTLGTYAAPTALKCRFKEVDATNEPGLYELQFADARYAIAGSKTLVVSVSGFANLLESDYEIDLIVDLDGYKDGLVYLKEGVGNTNTQKGIDGTFDNPVSTMSAAKTIANSIGSSRISVDGEISFGDNMTGFELIGMGQNGEITGTAGSNISDGIVRNLRVLGEMVCNSLTRILDGEVSSLTKWVGIIKNCKLTSSITPFSVTGNKQLVNCYGKFFDLVMSTTNSEVRVHNFSGLIRISGMNAIFKNLNVWSDGKTEISFDSSNTSASASATLEGVGKLIDNSAGAIINTNYWEDILDLKIAKYEGAVWYDSTAINTGAIFSVDGIPSKKVSSAANAKTLVDLLGTKKINIDEGTFTVAEDLLNYDFAGEFNRSSIELSSAFSVEGSTFRRLFVDVVGASPGLKAGDDAVFFEECMFFANSIANFVGEYTRCGFDGSMTLTVVSDISLVNCYSIERALPVVFNFPASGERFRFINWVGDIAIGTITGTAKVHIHMIGGDIEILASCTSGEVLLSGFYNLTNNTGGTTVTEKGIDTNSGFGDWTSTEKEQIRHRINIDGSQSVPTIGGAAKMAGTDADLTLQSLKIKAPSGNAVEFEASGFAPNDGIGLKILGRGDGAGLKIDGGGGGHGMHLAGGASIGHGAMLEATGDTAPSHGLFVKGSADGTGAAMRVAIDGIFTADAVELQGSGEGTGLRSKSGTGATGSGAIIESKATNGHGLETVKTGTGIDLKASLHGDGSWETGAAGGATEAKQDTLIAGQAVLSSEHAAINVNINDNEAKIDTVQIDVTAIKVVTDILALVDGVTLEDRERFALAYVKGKITRAGNSFIYFAQNGSTVLFTLTGSIA